MKKRILSILLTFVMVIGMLPTVALAAPSDKLKKMTINSIPYYAEELDETINTAAHTWQWLADQQSLYLRSYNGTDIRFYPDDELTGSYILPIHVSGDCTINGDLIVDSRISTQLEALAESKLQIYMEHGASLTITGKIYAHDVAIYGPNTAGAKATVTVNGGIQCPFNDHRAGGYDKTLITGDVKALIGNGSNEYGISIRSVKVESPAYALIQGSSYALKTGEIVDAAEDDYTVTQTTKRVEVTPKVSTKDLTKIAVTTNPTKQEYFIGDDFDPAGMVVTAYYDDGSSKVLSSSDYTLQQHIDMPKGEGSGFLHGVRIVYEEDGITEDTWVMVKIEKSAGELTSIKITKYPTKTKYRVHDDFDPAGMVVTAYYANGTSSPVTDYTLSKDKNLQVGEAPNYTKSVQVSYTENDHTENVYVVIYVKESWPLESIAITKAPNKTAYTSGESFESTGMEVTAYYEDGSSKVLDSDDYTISVADPLVSGVTAAYVSYTENGVGKTAKQAITVTAAGGGGGETPEPTGKTLTKIEISTQPTKKNYRVGADFDPAGMVVTATYDDGTTADVTAKVTFSNDKDLQAGEAPNYTKSVRVLYTENGKTEGAWVTVYVKESWPLTGIAITKAPNKTAYTSGESFDSAGMEVTAYYEDGSSKVLDSGDYIISVADPLVSGVTAAYVRYTENGVQQSAEQAITVTAAGGEAEKTPINAVSVNFTVPSAGADATATPAYNIPTGVKYTCGGAAWRTAGGSGLGGTFGAGNNYSIVFILYPGDGETFADPEDITVTVNGVVNNDVVIQKTASGIELRVPFTVAGGSETPEKTAAPTITYDEETFTVSAGGNGTVILKVDGEVVENPYTFEKDETEKTYAVTATAQEAGKEISETATLSVTVPAKEAEKTPINAVSVNFTVPSAGDDATADPAYNIPTGVKYTCGGAAWRTASGSGLGGTFGAGNNYSIFFILYPGDGETFADPEDITVTVNGVVNNNVVIQETASGIELLVPFTVSDGSEPEPTIYTVSVSGITEPVKGATPVFAATVPADAGYMIHDRDDLGYVNGIMWEGYYEKSNGEITNKYTMDADDTFLSGYTYVATVLVEPKDGYEFYYAEGSLDPTKPDVTATMNGETATFNKDSTWLIVQRAFYVPMDVINHGFTQLPAGGEVYPGEELTVTWATDFNPTKIEIHTVVSASSYNLVKTLDGTATSTSLPANKFPYIVVAYYGTGANEFKVTSPFTITEKELVEITAVEVNIAAPVAGNKPSYTASVPADAGYAVKMEYANYYTQGVMWEEVTETTREWTNAEFVEGHNYLFTVLLKPKDGYEFRRDVAVPDLDLKVNGISEGVSCKFYDMGNDIIMVQYLFTAKGTTLTGATTDGIKVTVENLKDSGTLIVAQYNGGKMVDVQTMTVSADNTYNFTGLIHKTGCTYKAFLVNSTTYAPLCEAKPFS